MKTLINTIVIATAFGLSSSAFADKWKHYNKPYQSQHGEYAKVVHVEPIYKTIRVREPHRECWSEPTRTSGQSYTSTIAGGIVGGVIGNQFGGGSGKKILTVAGSLLGGSIGRDYEQQNHHSTQYVERCEVQDRFHEEHVVDGYHVKYRYHGKTYSTHMDHYPGERIPVNVEVSPRYSY